MRIFSVSCLTKTLPARLVSLVAATVLISWTTVVKAQADATPTDPPPDSGAAAATPEVAYDTMPVNEDKKRDSLKIGKMVREGKFATDDEKEQFDSYYKEYSLSRWSVPQNQEQLIKPEEKATATPGAATGFRRDLRNQFIAAKSGQVYDRLNELVIEVLGAIATGNYHPACRYNAMLAIADLNVAQPATSETPKPLPKALALLVAALKDPKQIDAVKVAALVGIGRHAKLGPIADNQVRAAVLAEAIKLATTTTPPKGRTPEGHAWMRALAAEVLGRIGAPGAKGEMVDALGAMVADGSLAMSARREAARALGQIKYNEASPASAAKAAKALARLVVDIHKTEEMQDLSRRRFKDRMAAISFGINGYDFNTKDPPAGLGLSGGATDAAGKKVMAVLQPAVLAIIEALDDSKVKDSAVLARVGEPIANVKKLLSADTKPAETETP